MGMKGIWKLAFDGFQLVRYNALVEPCIILEGGDLGDELFGSVAALFVIWRLLGG